MRHTDPCPWCGHTPCERTCTAGELDGRTTFAIFAILVAALIGAAALALWVIT